jgi:hypothetical protein
MAKNLCRASRTVQGKKSDSRRPCCKRRRPGVCHASGAKRTAKNLPLSCAYAKTHGKSCHLSHAPCKKRTAKIMCQLPDMATLPCAGHKTDGKMTFSFLFFLFSLLKFPIQPKITGIIFITSIIYSRTVSARCARPIKSALS